MILRTAFCSLVLLAPALAHAQSTAPQTYERLCAGCHGSGRLGGTGPALIPETLSRIRGPVLAEVIGKGRSGNANAGIRGPALGGRDYGPCRVS